MLDILVKAMPEYILSSIKELGNCCDCISVVTPTDKHADVAFQLIEWDCHLLIEKSPTSTTADADKIVPAVDGCDKILQLGLIEHYNPVFKFLESVVISPKFITSQRPASFNARGTEVGAVIDHMIHDIGETPKPVKSRVASIDVVGINVPPKNEGTANDRPHFVMDMSLIWMQVV